ncbi:MAG: PAS domain-containing protein, partial [Myxococcota bacterium]
MSLLKGFEVNHDLVLSVSEDGHCLYVGPTPLPTGLFESVPQIGTQLGDVLTPTVRPLFMDVLEGIEPGDGCAFECMLERPERCYMVEAVHQGEQILILGRLKVEDPFRKALMGEAGELLRSTLERLSHGVLLQGPQAEILMSNSAALRLLGLTESQLLGSSSFDERWHVIREDGTPFPGPEHPVPQAIATRSVVKGVLMGVFRPRTEDRVHLKPDPILG